MQHEVNRTGRIQKNGRQRKKEEKFRAQNRASNIPSKTLHIFHSQIVHVHLSERVKSPVQNPVTNQYGQSLSNAAQPLLYP
jgi:hypothetical protein